MKKLSILFLIPLMALSACHGNQTPPDTSKERTINGVITCDEQPLSNVSVSIRSTSYQSLSDEEGAFSIKLSKEDSEEVSYTLLANKENYVEVRKTIVATDFVNNICNVSIAMFSTMMVVCGVVKDENNNPIEDVNVSVGNESHQTNASGEYSFTTARIDESFSIIFQKDTFENYVYEVTDFTKSVYEVNVTMTKTSYHVSGHIGSNYLPSIEGAKVTVKKDGQTGPSTFSDADGDFTINNIVNIALPYEVLIEKEGFESQSVRINEKNASIDVDLATAYQELKGRVFPALVDNATFKISRDTTFLYFKGTVSRELRYENGKEENISLFLSTGETSNNRSRNTIIEVKMSSNDDIVSLWDYSNGEPQSLGGTGITWGDEVVFETNFNADTSITSLFLKVKFDVFRRFGSKYSSVNKDSTIGITIGMFSDFSMLWTGWDTDGIMKAYNGSTFIDPINPYNYIRFNKEGFLYQSPSNEYILPGTYTISGIITDGENNPLEDVVVSVDNSSLSATTDSSGQYILDFRNEYLGLIPNLTISKDGYISIKESHTRSEFVNYAFEVNAKLELDTSHAYVLTGEWGKDPWTSKFYRENNNLVFVMTTKGDFVTPTEGGKENVCSIWLAFGDTALASTSRSGKDILELKFLSTRAWCGVYSYRSNAFVTWASGVSFNWSNNNKTITYTISLSYIRSVAGFSDFEIDDTIGVSFSQYDGGLADPYQGWILETGWYVNPDNPSTYARWHNDNTLTFGD